MKYFTPDLYVHLQDQDDAAMDAADAAWEAASQRYDAYLQTILPDLPASVRQLLDGYCLHDAEVLSAGRQGDAFVILLRLDVPPNDWLSITYMLTEAPVIDRSVFPTEHRTSYMGWLYEELEVRDTVDRNHYLHSILFSNGWEIQVPFRDVRLATVQPVYPCSGQAAPLPSSHAPQIS